MAIEPETAAPLEASGAQNSGPPSCSEVSSQSLPAMDTTAGTLPNGGNGDQRAGQGSGMAHATAATNYMVTLDMLNGTTKIRP